MKIQSHITSILSTVAIALTLSSCSSTSSEKLSQNQELDARFGHILIDSFSVSDVDVPTVVKKLNGILKENQEDSIAFVWVPDTAGVNNDFGDAIGDSEDWDDDNWGDDEDEPEEWAQIRKDGEKIKDEYYSQTLTVNEKDIPLPSLIRIIACIADLGVSIIDGRIWLHEKYRYRNRYVHGVRLYRILPRYAYVFDRPKEYFERRGVFFGKDLLGAPEGVGFDVKSSTLVITIMNDRFRHERIVQLIKPLLDKSETSGGGEQEPRPMVR